MELHRHHQELSKLLIQALDRMQKNIIYNLIMYLFYLNCIFNKYLLSCNQ